jgi:hypothetical protein
MFFTVSYSIIMWNLEVEIPLIFTPKRGEVFRPTSDNPQGAINTVLAGKEFIYTKSLGDVKASTDLFHIRPHLPIQ